MQKSGCGGDPPGAGPRIPRIMFDALGHDKSDASLPAPAYGAAQRRIWQQGKDVTADGSDNQDWAALVAAVRDRQDRAAFAALFRHFAPRVKGFLMKSGADAALAEECAQDVMAVLWQKAHLFDPARASVSTWVFTIARNRRIDVLRRSRRPDPEDLPWGPEPEPDQAEVLEVRQETERLGEALARLPENQRALIERAYWGEVSHSEIATETGLPLGTIKSRIRLALERLRQELK